MILVGVTDAGALAAIDCGTNSTRLLVVGSAGDVRAREMTITRLGEGVDATRRLSPEAMERTFAALRAYRSIMDAERVGRARLVATSAVRDAANGEAFLLPAAEIIGAPAELLPGIEEGRLSYAGATSDLPVTDAAAVVLDIGGGSTEMVTKAEEEILSVSLDIGCVRLTERFLRGDPPTASEVADAVEANLDRERVRRCLDSLTDIQRESVTLAYYGGYSYREVAGVLSVALGTIKTRIRDGLIRMRDCMGVVS